MRYILGAALATSMLLSVGITTAPAAGFGRYTGVACKNLPPWASCSLFQGQAGCDEQRSLVGLPRMLLLISH